MKGVTDALRRLEGAGEIEIDLQNGRATLRPLPEARFRPSEIAGVVRRSGYRTGEVTVLATGVATEGGGRWRFRLPNDPEPYATSEPGHATGEVGVSLVFGADGSVEVQRASSP